MACTIGETDASHPVGAQPLLYLNFSVPHRFGGGETDVTTGTGGPKRSTLQRTESNTHILEKNAHIRQMVIPRIPSIVGNFHRGSHAYKWAPKTWLSVLSN